MVSSRVQRFRQLQGRRFWSHHAGLDVEYGLGKCAESAESAESAQPDLSPNASPPTVACTKCGSSPT